MASPEASEPVTAGPEAFRSLGDPNASELSSRVVRGLGWKLVSQIATQGARIVVGITLARLLTPNEFGLAAMALVVTAFVIPFADMGLGSALVQRASIDETDRSTVFWASVGAGFSLSLLGFAVAPFIADFYGNDAVGPLVSVLCLSFAITSLGATHRSLLARAMNFKSLELRYAAGTVAGGVGAVLVAAMGYGAWAFVAFELVLGVVSTVLLWSIVSWRPHLRFGRRNFRELSGFGFRALGGATFTNLSRNADNILIGRYLGAYPLGLYAFAYNLMLASVTKIVVPVQQVMFPALSRLQEDGKRLALSWVRANRVLATISVPLLVLVMIMAGDLVPLVFGRRWDRAVPLVQILCWAGIVECLVALNEVVLKAQGAVKTYLRFNAVAFAVNLLSFIVGLHWGVNGVATAFAVSNTALGIVYTWLVLRRTSLALGRIVAEFRGVTLAILGMAGCSVAARWFLIARDVPTGVRLIVVAEVAVTVYVWLLRWLAREVLAEIRQVISRSRAQSPQGRATTDVRPAAAART